MVAKSRESSAVPTLEIVIISVAVFEPAGPRTRVALLTFIVPIWPQTPSPLGWVA
jgi:hypothetical protein